MKRVYNDKMLHEQIRLVGSLSSPGMAHSFLGPAYQEVIAREFGKQGNTK
jgi:hypothetical protein